MNSVKGAPPLRASLRDLPSPPEGRIGWPWTEETPPVADVRPDGAPWPAISIVTPVHDRALDLEETLRSVLLQGYPRLEYVVVDDGSTDGSAEVIRRYDPWLAQCVSQEHRGLPEAINRGFEHATGDIFAYLTPDAILRPGALAAAAREIDPGRGQHIAMGRCSFIDATGRFIGVEHPSQFVSDERVLAVWKGQTIPQPSVFWAREVWRSCGPIEAGSAVDYDLCCRFASRYRFHFVDQVLSSYRLPSDPTGPMHGQRGGLEETVGISRRYWGGHGPPATGGWPPPSPPFASTDGAAASRHCAGAKRRSANDAPRRPWSTAPWRSSSPRRQCSCAPSTRSCADWPRAC